MQLQLRGNLVLTPWNDTGNTDFDAAANAILGAYIGSLGLSESAIFFMTVKGKDEDKFLYLGPRTALDRSGVTVTWRGGRRRSRGTVSSPPGPPSAGEVRAHEAISFAKASEPSAVPRRPSRRSIPSPASSIAFAAAFAKTTLAEAPPVADAVAGPRSRAQN